MNFLRHLIAWLLIGSVATLACAQSPLDASQSDEVVDPGFCIIRPDEPASAEIFADHNGQRYYFCCESCRSDFLSDPSRFEGLSESAGETQPLNLEDLPSNPYADSFWGRVGRIVLKLETAGTSISETLHLNDPLSLLLSVVAISWVSFFAWQSRRNPNRHVRWKPSWSTAVLLTLLFIPCYLADDLRHKLNASQTAFTESESQRVRSEELNTEYHDRDLIHYATFLNHGNPPRPRPSTLPPSLEKTYYRGNDERAADMPHGGNYRTVTFELWLEDAAGQRIEPDSPLIDESGEPIKLYLAARFIRSPDTSSGYFGDEYMKRMYLTMQTGEFLGRDEPVADRVQWDMTEPNVTWEARFPLPNGVMLLEKPATGWTPIVSRAVLPDRPYDRSGIVYLCEDRFWGPKMIGGRFHYAVQYELKTADGKLSPESDLWMQATYRGRNFADLQIADDEWLSTEPLPEK